MRIVLNDAFFDDLFVQESSSQTLKKSTANFDGCPRYIIEKLLRGVSPERGPYALNEGKCALQVQHLNTYCLHFTLL